MGLYRKRKKNQKDPKPLKSKQDKALADTKQLSKRKSKFSKYEFFDKASVRSNLYSHCRDLAEYLFDNEIYNVIFVDRSIQPMQAGVNEIFQRKHPSEERPEFYFANPRGFDPETFAEPTSDFMLNLFKNEQDLNSPVVIFNSCYHSSANVDVIKTKLESAGFTNILVWPPSQAELLAEPVEDETAPKICLYALHQSKEVMQVFDFTLSMQSLVSFDLSRLKRLRVEIRKIIRELDRKIVKQSNTETVSAGR